MIGAKNRAAASSRSPSALTSLSLVVTLRLRTFGGLWIENTDAATRGGVRPRRLALLALLASAGRKGLSREKVLGVLWPESEPDRARHALSQTLYNLRADLDTDVVLATPSDLRLDPARLTSDLEDFRTAVAAKDWPSAASLYTAAFLDGFYLSDAPEFERWADEERSRLAREGTRAIERVARAATDAGHGHEAAEHWHRLTLLDPLSGTYAAAYMEALARAGDRSTALAHGQAHTELVHKELDIDPDQEVVDSLVRLRDAGAKLPRRRAAPSPTTATLPPVADDVSTAARAPVATAALVRYRPLAQAAIAVAIVIAGVLLWRVVSGASAERATPVLAVGQIRDLVTPDSVQLGGVLSEMLATSIGRLTNLQVIANSRLLEIIPRGADTVRAARTAAARRAGATQVLEGELIPLPERKLRFQLRRVDVPNGIVRAGYQIDGTDRIALFDSIAVHIAADLGVAPPARSLAEASTSSPIAYRFYEEGLRALTLFDVRAAHRLFSAAVRADSTFAMATYYRWRSEILLADPQQHATAERALTLAPHAADRDRLLILTYVRVTQMDPAAVPVAESLVTRYPNDPEALVRASEAIASMPQAVALLNRAIALDSSAGAAASAYCRMCDALHELANRYRSADSVAAEEQTLRRWIRFRPHDSAPWAVLADHLVATGRRSGADSALQRAFALGASPGNEGVHRLSWSLRMDDVATANDLCRTELAESQGDVLGTIRWLCVIALRMQGRYRDAWRLVRRGPASDALSAILDWDGGEPRAAAARFLRLAQAAQREHARLPGLAARNIAWNLTLAGTAYAEAGDTLNVRRLVNSVAATGQRSLYRRDPLLHRFLRGLLLASAAKHDSAVGEYRAALHSPSLGYTRINYELAKSLIALKRPAEATPVLRAALRGGLDGPGLYLTRTETHELLARAFDAAGRSDSAAAHYLIVERAWRNADTPLKPRYEAARARLVALGKAPV